MARIRVSDACLQPGCQRPTVARGFCPMHWQRLRYAGAFGKERADDARLAARRRGLMRWHNMTLEEFDERLASQGGVCGLCGEGIPSGQQWHVDHDHACCPDTKSCGQCTRGILCPGCNTSLKSHGPDWFGKAKSYLDGCR